MTKSRTRCVALSVLAGIMFLAALAPDGRAQDPRAYMVSSTHQFGTVDLATGVFILDGTGSAELSGLGVVNGNLYGGGGGGTSSTLYQVSPGAGILSTLGSGSIPAYADTGSTTAGLYAVDFSLNLYTIDPGTGATTLIGPTGLRLSFGAGLSAGSGTLYLALFPDVVSPSIFYSVNTATGAATMIGSSAPAIGAMVFENGTLYAGSDAASNALYTVDPNTGAYTFVANLSGGANNFQGLAPINNKAHFPRPSPMGVSIGNTTGKASPCMDTTPCASGTAGLLVHTIGNSAEKFILSNNHILSAVGPTFCPGTAPPGTWTLQPGTGDIHTDPGNDERYHVATFVRGTTNFEIDAALASTDSTMAMDAIFGIGPPNPQVGLATLGESVVKSGEGTGRTLGVVEDVNFTAKVFIPLRCGGGDEVFRHQIAIMDILDRQFSGKGDSGSAVLDSRTKTPVGLLVGFACSYLPPGCATFANPISTVYQDLNVFPDSPSGAGPTSQQELASQIEALKKTLDPRLVLVQEIQERHVDKVLSIAGVQGMGIGLDENGHDLVFHVYVIERTAALTAAIPQEIEGVPVRLLVTGGEFKFL